MASTRSTYEKANPTDILKDIVAHEKSDIIRTKLDQSVHTQEFGAENKLSWTLESVRQNIAPYLQWAAFIWLSAAVTLIIYNGLLLVLTPLSADQASKVKSRIMYISLWLVVITWFYFALKIMLAIYYDIFAK